MDSIWKLLPALLAFIFCVNYTDNLSAQPEGMIRPAPQNESQAAFLRWQSLVREKPESLPLVKVNSEPGSASFSRLKFRNAGRLIPGFDDYRGYGFRFRTPANKGTQLKLIWSWLPLLPNTAWYLIHINEGDEIHGFENFYRDPVPEKYIDEYEFLADGDIWLFQELPFSGPTWKEGKLAYSWKEKVNGREKYSRPTLKPDSEYAIVFSSPAENERNTFFASVNVFSRYQAIKHLMHVKKQP